MLFVFQDGIVTEAWINMWTNSSLSVVCVSGRHCDEGGVDQHVDEHVTKGCLCFRTA